MWGWFLLFTLVQSSEICTTEKIVNCLLQYADKNGDRKIMPEEWDYFMNESPQAKRFVQQNGELKVKKCIIYDYDNGQQRHTPNFEGLQGCNDAEELRENICGICNQN